MNATLSSRQQRAADDFFDIAFDANQNGTGRVFERLLGPIAELTQADFAGWHRIGFGERSAVAAMWPDPTLGARAEEHLQERLETHPLLCHYAHQRTLAVLDVRDVSSISEWRRSVAYEVISNEYGVREQVAIPVAYAGGAFLCYAIGKGRHTFDQRERDIATWIQRALMRLHSHEHAGACDRLTKRELAVLDAMSSGVTRVAAAHSLSMSPRTLDKHLEHVYAKLGVNSLVAALSVGSSPRPSRS